MDKPLSVFLSYSTHNLLAAQAQLWPSKEMMSFKVWREYLSCVCEEAATCHTARVYAGQTCRLAHHARHRGRAYQAHTALPRGSVSHIEGAPKAQTAPSVWVARRLWQEVGCPAQPPSGVGGIGHCGPPCGRTAVDCAPQPREAEGRCGREARNALASAIGQGEQPRRGVVCRHCACHSRGT